MAVISDESTSEKLEARDLEQAKTGPTPSQRRNLMEKYVPLAKTLAKPYKKADPNEADTIDSVALEALVDAALDFDPVTYPHVKFGTWLARKVKGRVSTWSASENLRKSRYEEVGGYDYADRARDVPLDNVVRSEEVRAAKERAELVLEEMPEDSAEALRLVCMQGLGMIAAAKQLGVSRSAVYERLVKGKEVARGEKAFGPGAAKEGRDEKGRYLPGAVEVS